MDARELAAALQARGGMPLHSQLESMLRRLIEQGQIATGAIGQSAQETGVPHALGVLTNEGLLRRERGRGTTVVSDTPRLFERSLSAFYAFAWEARARGANQRSYVLERQVLTADEGLAVRLHVEPGTELEHIVRLRTADDDPLVFESAYLPRALTIALEASALERESIYDELERLHGLRVTRAHESIRPIVLSRPVARLLRASVGAPAFSVERTTWSEQGPIEWQESVVRGDRYLYSVDLPRQAQTSRQREVLVCRVRRIPEKIGQSNGPGGNGKDRDDDDHGDTVCPRPEQLGHSAPSSSAELPRRCARPQLMMYAIALTRFGAAWPSRQMRV